MPNSRRRFQARRRTRGLVSPRLLAGLVVGLAQVVLVPAAAIPGIAGAMTSCQNWTGLPSVNDGRAVGIAAAGAEVWAVSDSGSPSHILAVHCR
jgi:hypothetical protein